MKGGIFFDAEAPHLVQQCFALVQAVRGKRQRFPENVVEVVDSAEEALRRQAPADNLHAAEVMGPSRSSEGFRLKCRNPASPGRSRAVPRHLRRP